MDYREMNQHHDEMAGENGVQLTNLKKLRKQRKLTQEQLAEAAGFSTATISQLESGKQGFTQDTLTALSDALGCNPVDLFAQLNKINLTENIDYLEVIGVSYAGIWRDNSLGVPAMKNVPRVGADLRYPPESQYLIKIEGNSMDLVAHDGAFAHCVDFPATGRAIQDGNLVIAVRTKPDGTEETTVKRVKIKSGKAELWPESTNSNYKPFILGNGNPDITVNVKALILRFYGPDLI